jgi:valyl-tRNA synthetase
LAEKSPFLMSSAWPQFSDELSFQEDEERMEQTFEVTRGLRALRASIDLTPMKVIPVAYFEGDLAGGESVLASQGWVQELRRGRPGERAVSSTVGGIDLHIPIGDLVDLDKMVGNLKREQEKLSAERLKLGQRLENPQFVERAKPEVIERDRALLVDMDSRLAKIEERLRLFQD